MHFCACVQLAAILLGVCWFNCPEMRDNNCSSDSIYQKSNYVRGVSGASCAASLVGSVLIILSYMCFKRLRTKVREILVHLSVADSGVAAANLVGIVVYFDRFYNIQCDEEGKVYNIVPPQHHITILCNVQAFFALYFTLSSILWTVSLAVYLYFLLVHHGTSKARLFLVFAYFFCYGMPLLLTLWAMLTHKLGYSPYNSAGWCSVILVNPIYPHQRDIFMGIIGYDLWIYLALVLVSVLYFAIRAFLREEVILYTPVYTHCTILYYATQTACDTGCMCSM
jgi:G protein-coupled receptor 157